MHIPLVDLRAQYEAIRQEIDDAIREVLERGEFVLGRVVERFEQDFAAYCGVRHAVGVSNGTDAIMLALRAAGVGPGHEVVTVANTFIATTEAVSMTGARGKRFHKSCHVQAHSRLNLTHCARSASLKY